MTTEPLPSAKPVRVGPRPLSCGHDAAPGQSEDHDVCPACYAKARAAEIYRFEKEQGLDVVIRGKSPKAVTYARGIRYRVLKALLQRLSAEGEVPWLQDYVAEFRRNPDAQWFISRRFMSVAKLRPPRKEKPTFDMSKLMSNSFDDLEKGPDQ